MTRMPFNRPYATGREFEHIREAIENLHLSGDGPFSHRCAHWLEERTGCELALLTTSCTAALELAVLLAGIGPGDEVVMPSYTFVSTANAVALRGATPVFVDIRPDTLNLDETAVEAAITERTRAIMPVHYAGVACAMDELCALAERHGLTVIEDAAQGAMASYRGAALGSIGALGCLSFHETKNLMSGEGGALLVNDPALVERAEILHAKGTDRRRFLRGQVDRYTWRDLGSSFTASDLTAAFLWAQLQEAEELTRRRMALWRRYEGRFADLEAAGLVRRPVVPSGCDFNGHLFYLLAGDRGGRDRLIAALAEQGVQSVFHYVPLHSSPAGLRYGRVAGSMAVTDDISGRLLRLPLWVGMTSEDVDRVVDAVAGALAR
jgi:dTDP-4-amino-4,6-dideoxygalactose transaminase